MDRYLSHYLHGAVTDPVLAISEALRDCGDGDVLHLGGGKIVLGRTYAHPTNYYLPRYFDLTKYYAIYLDRKRNLIIDGDGAELILKGDLSGIGLDGCENITLRNFNMDYQMPCWWQGIITESCDRYFEVKYDPEKYPCEYDPTKKVLRFGRGDGEPPQEAASLLVNEFDPERCCLTRSSPRIDYFLCTDQPDPVYASMSVITDVMQTASDRMRFTFRDKHKLHTVGSIFTATIHDRRNNNIHLNRCRNITLEHINMYASASFGVISLLTDGLSIADVNSVLKPGTDRMLAVIADMFHCVNNRGQISIENCTMNNQKDDAVNVHSLLCEAVQILDAHTVIVGFPYLAKRALDLFSAGEKLHTLNPDTFLRGDELTVVRSELLGQYHLRIEFEETVTQDLCGLFLESTDAMPEIRIAGCQLGNNRGRGILVSSSRKTVIENNRIYSSGNGISIGGCSRAYMEGGAVRDVTIRGNHFDDCAYSGGCYGISILPYEIIKTRTTPYHRNIRIEGNRFTLAHPRMIRAGLTAGLVIDGNEFVITDKAAGNQPECTLEKCEVSRMQKLSFCTK